MTKRLVAGVVVSAAIGLILGLGGCEKKEGSATNDNNPDRPTKPLGQSASPLSLRRWRLVQAGFQTVSRAIRPDYCDAAVFSFRPCSWALA